MVSQSVHGCVCVVLSVCFLLISDGGGGGSERVCPGDMPFLGGQGMHINSGHSYCGWGWRGDKTTKKTTHTVGTCCPERCVSAVSKSTSSLTLVLCCPMKCYTWEPAVTTVTTLSLCHVRFHLFFNVFLTVSFFSLMSSLALNPSAPAFAFQASCVCFSWYLKTLKWQWELMIEPGC